MGNSNQGSSNPFYASSNNKQSQLAQLLQQFTFVSNFQDELFGRCSIIEHKQTKQSIITKEIVCESEVEINKLHQDFERRKNTLNNINLLRLRYIIKKKTEGIFSDQYKLILFFDYIFTPILSEYQNRVKNQKYFTHEEINIITCGTLRAYAALQNENIPNTKVRLSNIYFGLQNGMSIPKVIDSKLFPSPTNMNLVKRQQSLDDVFLSPQELKYIQEPNYTNQKSGVFSLAVSLLQLCLLVKSKDLYNYNKRSINYPQLENRLNIIKNKYPLSIYCILRDMLERNQDSRPSFSKLASTLPSNLKNLPTTLNISLMKGTNNNSQTSSKFMNSTLSNNFSKIKSPLSDSRNSKRGTLASQYRPQTENSQVYTNGNRYEGQKKDSLRHGRGKYIYNDGSYYMGDWIKGKMQGQGQLYDSNGMLIYDGSWKDDHYEGNGRLINNDDQEWIKYQGQFRCGQKEGFGQLWFNDGTKYKGQFRNDLPWGKGRFFGKNGQIKNGIWQKGNFISEH